LAIRIYLHAFYHARAHVVFIPTTQIVCSAIVRFDNDCTRYQLPQRFCTFTDFVQRPTVYTSDRFGVIRLIGPIENKPDKKTPLTKIQNVSFTHDRNPTFVRSHRAACSMKKGDRTVIMNMEIVDP